VTTYRYIARDFSGQVKEGLTQAACETDVLGWLHEQGCTPVSVDVISKGLARRWQIPFIGRIKSSELAAVFWQLTTMTDGGVSITESLEAIAEDIENVKLERILRRILERIESGGNFSESMLEFPKTFNHLCCSLVLSGETGGNIAVAFHRVAEYFTNRDRLARKLKKAMAYPCLVLGFVVLVVVLIMTLIIPRFRELFNQFGAGQLPAFTRAFMGVYGGLLHYGHYIVGSILLVLIISILAYGKNRRVHYLFSRIALRLPLFGRLLNQAFMATFCRTMAALLRGGVPVLEAFDILSEMTANDIINSVITQTREDIVKGSNIYLSMAAAGFFPNMLVKMVKAGEESGSLWKLLDRTADYYEEKVDALVSTITTLLEPLMIIIVGAIVLTVVVALYLPIFTLSDIAG
jgi:type IV pilus assembly protein PilC